MPLVVLPPRIVAHQEADGTWTASLYVEGRLHAQMKGFATSAEARAAIRERYLNL